MKHTEILKKVIKALHDKLPKFENDKIILPLEDYTAFEISEKNFQGISPELSKRKIAFVDGGNAELVGAPNFSVHFVRIAYCIFQENRRIESKQSQFYVLVTAEFKDNKIIYSAQTFQSTDAKLPDSADLVFKSDDETLREGLKMFPVSRLGSIVRRFAELKAAAELCNQLDEGSIIVLDGTLESSVTNEEKYLEGLFSNALKKNILVSALAKTTTYLSDNANSVNAILGELGPAGTWYYNPVTDIRSRNYQADISFVKLHQNSDYVFRFEVLKKQKPDYGVVLGILAANSKDMCFPGYPYGLIITDRLARVTNREKEYLMTQFRVYAGKAYERLKRYVNSTNAHDVLDGIS